MPISDTQAGMISSQNKTAVPVARDTTRTDNDALEKQIERISQLESLLSELSEADCKGPSDDDVVDRLQRRIDELENMLRELASPDAWALAWAREHEPWNRIRNVLDSHSN
ncbi:MAG: hypothetical protein P8N76_28775 [Pirellulaceae bacterium]|nr:hypothetical protein [Pirellulaceae bacterium]